MSLDTEAGLRRAGADFDRHARRAFGEHADIRRDGGTARARRDASPDSTACAPGRHR